MDFNWQLHSRDRNEYFYYKNDIVEGAKVIFDKDEIVRFVEIDRKIIANNKNSCRADCDYHYSQHFRVQKYILRGTLPECYAYHNRYVIEPLVIMLRLKYTPMYPHHYLLHISHHIPKADLTRLEKLLKISNLKGFDDGMKDAESWYKELQSEIYGLEE
ncbi:MAG: hypothetical protein A2Y17_10930 [Clostridiales bacterium GWF2_38_85]|nr:MAG: hypothetical protein A2Y17_10930 [Clostridiales bacterium GWF2_38_85]